jgi:hypothetical protein
MQRERPGIDGTLDKLDIRQGRVGSRLRLFALLALLVPLYAGLHSLVRDSVPRVEVRIVPQDVPSSAPVVVPVHVPVERIVYVPVGPTTAAAGLSTSPMFGQIDGKAQHTEDVLAQTPDESPISENPNAAAPVAAGGEPAPEAVAEAVQPPVDAPVIGVVALAPRLPIRSSAPVAVPAPEVAVEPEAPAESDELAEVAEVADEAGDLAMDEMEGAAEHLAGADLRIAGTAGVPYAPTAPVQPAEAEAPEADLGNPENEPTEGDEAVAEEPVAGTDSVAEEATETPPAEETVVIASTEESGPQLVTLTIEQRPVAAAPAEPEVHAEAPAADLAEDSAAPDVAVEEAEQPPTEVAEEPAASEDAAEQPAAAQPAEDAEAVKADEDQPDETAAVAGPAEDDGAEAASGEPAPAAPLANSGREQGVIVVGQ